ncbi:hypothetical protein ACFVX9_39870, partial [Kitasatospora sp. NPDC058243]
MLQQVYATPYPTDIAVTADGGNGAVGTERGEVYWVDLEAGSSSKTPIATGLAYCYSVAIDPDGEANVYAANYTRGELYKVPVGGGDKTLIAKGMTNPCHMFLRPNSGPGNIYKYLYIICTNGDLWRIVLDGGTAAGGVAGGLTVSRDTDLSVFNLGSARDVKIDAAGVAYVVGYDGYLWTVKDVDDPLQAGGPGGLAAPVVITPGEGSVQPDPRVVFGGTAAGAVSVSAAEGSVQVAAGVGVNPATSGWSFMRDDGQPWGEGPHTVAVTAHDSAGGFSQSAVVDFSVGSGGTGGPGGDTGAFSVSPAAGYPQYLDPGGAPGYPAVQLVNTGQVSVSARDVTVSLPAGKQLEFVPKASGQYALTVMSDAPWTTEYPAVLAAGGQSLTARAVDLALPAPGSHSA